MTKLCKNKRMFDFGSICVQEDKFCGIDTTTRIGRHVPISVSGLSNLIERPIVLCNSNPRALVESIVDARDGLATQSKEQTKLTFFWRIRPA